MGAGASVNREGVPTKPLQQETTTEPADPTTCPVDHKSREIWLQQARTSRQVKLQSLPLSQPKSSTTTGESCDSSQLDQTHHPQAVPSLQTQFGLGTEREVSTIPRAFSSPSSDERPANHEVESGRDSKSGNWIYPSEQMFFDAMKRKKYNPQAKDMESIVPIHNAVNERAWQEILKWEQGRGSENCGGPKLMSFSGQATSLTPKARINSLLGYTAPFDRHDWVVDRCGTRVEYVIDFYAGKDEGKPGKSLNFYLDVRPKLNSWEGCRMRAVKLLGL